MTRNFQTLYGKGYSCQVKGDFASAVEFFKQALNEQPENAWIYHRIGANLLQLNRKSEADFYLERALTLYRQKDSNYKKDKAQIAYRQACIYSLLRQKEKAYQALLQAINLNHRLSRNAVNENDLMYVLNEPNFQALVDDSLKKRDVYDVFATISEKGTFLLYAIIIVNILLIWLFSIPSSILILNGIETAFGFTNNSVTLLATLVLLLSAICIFLFGYLLKNSSVNVANLQLKSEQFLWICLIGLGIIGFFLSWTIVETTASVFNLSHYLAQIHQLSLYLFVIILIIIFIPGLITIMREPL